MFPSSRVAAHSQMLAPSQAAIIPDFLLPAFAHRQGRRQRPFSSTSQQRSRIGAAPITIPESVTLTVIEPPPPRGGIVRRVAVPKTLNIEGPLGKISLPFPHFMQFSHDTTARKAAFAVLDQARRVQREMWGTTRATLANAILGVTEGHSTILRLNGVGYRATIEKSAITKKPEYDGQQFVSLKLGYRHPIEMPVPSGVRVSTPQPTRILLEGSSKEVVNKFAAEIREWRRPEPYKGKGIFVNGETIRLKAKKIK